MDRRHIAAGGLLLVGTLIGGSTFVLGSGAAIQNLSVDVILNDDFAGDVPQGDVTACTGVGIPPDQLVITLEGAVDDHWSGWVPSTITYELDIRLGAQTRTRTLTMSDGGYRRINSFVTFPDNESLTPSDRATVTVSLLHDGNTVETVSRTTPVTAQNLTCADSEG